MLSVVLRLTKLSLRVTIFQSLVYLSHLRFSLKNLQALALDVTVLDEDGNEVKLGEDVDESENDSIKSLTDDDETYDAFDNGESYASAGYIEGTPDELEDAFGATMVDTDSVFDD